MNRMVSLCCKGFRQQFSTVNEGSLPGLLPSSEPNVHNNSEARSISDF
jgi:hypothetical protein